MPDMGDTLSERVRGILDDPYESPVEVGWATRKHMHAEPICAFPDCQTYLTPDRMALTRIAALLDTPAPDDIAAKIERSSLGTPEAKALRASVSDEHAARIVAMAKELEDTPAPAPVGDVEGLAAVLAEHTLLDGSVRCTCGWKPSLKTDRQVWSTYDQYRIHVAEHIFASDWLAARDAAQWAEALYEARDALYRGEGPDAYADADIQYGEWLGNRADHEAR